MLLLPMTARLPKNCWRTCIIRTSSLPAAVTLVTLPSLLFPWPRCRCSNTVRCATIAVHHWSCLAQFRVPSVKTCPLTFNRDTLVHFLPQQASLLLPLCPLHLPQSLLVLHLVNSHFFEDAIANAHLDGRKASTIATFSNKIYA